MLAGGSLDDGQRTEAWLGNDAEALNGNALAFSDPRAGSCRLSWTARAGEGAEAPPFRFEGRARLTGLEIDVTRLADAPGLLDAAIGPAARRALGEPVVSQIAFKAAPPADGPTWRRLTYAL